MKTLATDGLDVEAETSVNPEFTQRHISSKYDQIEPIYLAQIVVTYISLRPVCVEWHDDGNELERIWKEATAS
jgi:hypothetical protein